MGELLDLVESVLVHVAPGEDLEAYAVHRTETTVQAGTGPVVRHVGRSETRGVGVRVVVSERMGNASTADLSPAGLASVVARARDNARVVDRDESAVLPRAERVAEVPGLWHAGLGATSLASKVEFTTELARRVTRIDPRVRALDTAEYHDEDVLVAIASSAGVRAEHRRAFAELYTDAIAEADDGSLTDYSYWCGRDPGAIDVAALAESAVERTCRLLGPLAVVPPDVPTVVDRAVVADLLVAIGRGCTGGALSTGRSAFAGRHGTPVAADTVTLVDDGTAVIAPQAAPFDDEGVGRRQTELVSAGTLVGALHSTGSAIAVGSGATSTGNARRATYKAAPRAAPTALRLQPHCSGAELLARAGDAIYLQQLGGGHSGISSISGRVDVGAVGYRMRDGRPAGRLPTVPVAASLESFLRAVHLVADDEEPVPGTPVIASTVLCAPGWFA
jgi:PmbA protein